VKQREQTPSKATLPSKNREEIVTSEAVRIAPPRAAWFPENLQENNPNAA
jgi:hypothetical protein